jgi:hypothetical protein
VNVSIGSLQALGLVFSEQRFDVLKHELPCPAAMLMLEDSEHEVNNSILLFIVYCYYVLSGQQFYMQK